MVMVRYCEIQMLLVCMRLSILNPYFDRVSPGLGASTNQTEVIQNNLMINKILVKIMNDKSLN